MKYCSRKPAKKKKGKFKIFLVLLLVFFILGFVYLELVINPVVVEATRQTILSLSSSVVSDAVYAVLEKENISYNDLVEISYTSSGEVAIINYQSAKMNLLARKIYQTAQGNLEKMGQDGVNIPLGAFSGIPFLAGLGPKVNIKMVPIGAMNSSFDNIFTSVGINQTNHSIFINLSASVSLILPAYKVSIESKTDVLIAQCVIVGKVPDTYLSSGEEIGYTIS